MQLVPNGWRQNPSICSSCIRAGLLQVTSLFLIGERKAAVKIRQLTYVVSHVSRAAITMEHFDFRDKDDLMFDDVGVELLILMLLIEKVFGG